VQAGQGHVGRRESNRMFPARTGGSACPKPKHTHQHQAGAVATKGACMPAATTPQKVSFLRCMMYLARALQVPARASVLLRRNCLHLEHLLMLLLLLSLLRSGAGSVGRKEEEEASTVGGARQAAGDK
jgi:hypothetical protein